MKILRSITLMLFASPLLAQSAPTAGTDPWKAIAFLQGTWSSSTSSAGSSGGTARGSYTFRMELRDHVLARHTVNVEGCKGPATFDCDHGDLLYIYQDMPGQPLKAIYFDNEGHVIHYDVSTPDTTTALLVSDGSQPGPQFRLIYQLKGITMTGKFQMRMPGQSEYKSYLEWSGEKQPQS
jgi:hypothetical protein